LLSDIAGEKLQSGVGSARVEKEHPNVEQHRQASPDSAPDERLLYAHHLLAALKDAEVEQLGESPEQVDALDATALLMRWARAKRGCQCTGYRGELWEFIVEIVDAALWLGWLFPQKSKARSSTERLRPGASRFTSYGRVTLKNLINFSERRRNNCHSLGRISGQAVHL
jgi:hypothetical protein